MARWRYKSLGEFPSGFHHAMAEGEGTDKVIGRYLTVSGVKRAQVEWQIFRYSIRLTPSAPLYQIETSLNHRTRISWNDAEKRWELLLTSKQSALSLLIDPKILE